MLTPDQSGHHDSAGAAQRAASRSASGRGRLLVLAAREETERLLRTSLEADYELLIPAIDAAASILEGGSFDLCIADGPSLERVAPSVRAAKAAVGPVFLPCLLVTPRDRMADAARLLGDLVDELIGEPLEPFEIETRVEALVGARRLSQTIHDAPGEDWFRLALRATELGVWVWDAATGRVSWSYNLEGLLGRPGVRPESLSSLLELVHPDDRARVMEAITAVLRQERYFWVEFRIVQPDGAVRWVADRGQPVRDADGRIVRMIGVVADVTAQHQVEEDLRTALRRQAVVAELSRFALTSPDLGALMDRAVEAVARTLDVALCKVLQLLPNRTAFRLQAGVGWQPGLVGHATVSADLDSQAGYTLLRSAPVVVDDLRTETRFTSPPLLCEHGVVSGVSVPIEGRVQPFGVLGAHSRRRRVFTPDEVRFVQTVAHLLAQAVGHREAEERLRVVTEQLPAAVWATDTELRLTYLTGRALAHVGMAATPLGQTLGEVLAQVAPRPPDLSVHLRALAGENVDFERQFEARFFRGHIRPLQDRAGNVIGVVGIAEDVTERTRAEAAVRESEQRWHALVELSPDAIWIDREDRIVFANGACLELLGATGASQVVGRSSFEFFHPDCQAAVRERIARIAAGAEPGPFQAGRIARLDGTERDVDVGTAGFVDQGMRAVQVVLRDVTALKRAEDELRASHDQLRALAGHLDDSLEEERTRIAREIHDELGQALAGLKMDVAWLGRQLARARATDIRKLGERTQAMAELADATVQTVRRIATRLRPGVLDDLGLAAAIEWLARDFEARTGLACKVAASPDVDRADRETTTALFRIVQEALTNVARHATARHVRIAAGRTGGRVRVEIEDDGMGFPPARRPGALGLLGMEERARRLGGELVVSSAPGRGTTITARVPLVRGNA